jgi:hypothetical protein
MTCNPPKASCPAWTQVRDKVLTKALRSAGTRVGWYGKRVNWDYECAGEKAIDGYPDLTGVHDSRVLGPGDASELFTKYSLIENGTKVDYDATVDPSHYGTYVTADLAEAGIDAQCAIGSCATFWMPMAPHRPGTQPPDYDPTKVLPGLVPWRPNWNEGCPGAFDPDDSDKPYMTRKFNSCLGAGRNRSVHQKSLQGVDNRLPNMVDRFLSQHPSRPKKIIIVSDHGFSFEHGIEGKEVPYEESLRTPLWIYDSDAPGGTVDSIVNILDLTATIEEWASAVPLLPSDSTSLVPLYTSGAGARPDAYSSHMRLQASVRYTRPWHALRQSCVQGSESGRW